MWKLIPASHRDFDFFGHKVKFGRGGVLQGSVEIQKVGNLTNLDIAIKSNNGVVIESRRLTKATNEWLRMYTSELYGAALYIWEEKPNNLASLAKKEGEINNTVNQSAAAPEKVSEKPNHLILVGKPFTKLVDGLRLLFKPYVGNGFQEYTAVVSRHRSPGASVECIQVHIQRDGKPHSTVNFTGDAHNLDYKCVSDLHFFDKFSCYLIKNFCKEADNNPFSPPAKAPKTKYVPDPLIRDTSAVVTAPKPDEDDVDGKYIIWCPTSDRAPQQILKGHKQAKAVAATMSEKYGKVFYWCRLMGVAKQVNKEVVTVKRVTEFVTL